MKRPTILTIVCLATSLAAGDTPDNSDAPKSPLAVSAIRKADAAETRAADAYDRAMFNLKYTEQDELKVALKVATQKGELDEANSINALLKKIGEEFKKPYVPGVRVDPPNVLGKWGHGDGVFTITESSVTKENLHESEMKLTGNVMTVDFKEGWHVRLTFEGDRAFEECWPPGRAASEAPILTIDTRQKEK